MAFFEILEPLIAILVVAFLISQCLFPELLGRPWFPIFRRGWKLRRNIDKAKESIAEGELEARLDNLKTKKGDQHDDTDRIPHRESEPKGGPSGTTAGVRP